MNCGLHDSLLGSVVLLAFASISACVPTAAGSPGANDEPLYEELFLAERGRLDEVPVGSRYDRVQLRGGAASIPRPGQRGDVRLPGLPLGDYGDLGDPSLTWRQFLESGEGCCSESIGRPNSGKLRDGREFPPRGPGFVRKNDKAAFGTDEAVAIVAWACAQITRLYPGTSAMVVGDFSKEGGGRLRPHKSHQSGRDVDLGFFLQGNQKLAYFKDATPENLDIEKTWSFVELLIATGQVEYLFIDRSLHQPLYSEAVRRGWDEEDLARLFEAPLGGQDGRGLIRHVRGHKHHMHVRFVCADGDEECK